MYLQALCHVHLHIPTSIFSTTPLRITQVSRYEKGKTNLDFTEARDSEWQWHQLGHMQVCTLLQTDNHTSTPPLCFFTGWMLFLPPNQQRQRTEVTAQLRMALIAYEQWCIEGYTAYTNLRVFFHSVY